MKTFKGNVTITKCPSTLAMLLGKKPTTFPFPFIARACYQHQEPLWIRGTIEKGVINVRQVA